MVDPTPRATLRDHRRRCKNLMPAMFPCPRHVSKVPDILFSPPPTVALSCWRSCGCSSSHTLKLKLAEVRARRHRPVESCWWRCYLLSAIVQLLPFVQGLSARVSSPPLPEGDADYPTNPARSCSVDPMLRHVPLLCSAWAATDRNSNPTKRPRIRLSRVDAAELTCRSMDCV
jgi:hypothetical protein